MEIQLFGLKLDFLRFYLCGHSSSVFLGVTSGVTRADHVPFHFILCCFSKLVLLVDMDEMVAETPVLILLGPSSVQEHY